MMSPLQQLRGMMDYQGLRFVLSVRFEHRATGDFYVFYDVEKDKEIAEVTSVEDALKFITSFTMQREEK